MNWCWDILSISSISWRADNVLLWFGRYLYYFEKGNTQVTSTIIQGLLEIIVTEIQSENTTQDLQVDAFLANMLRYIQFQKHKGDVVAKRYIDIQVPS